MNDSITINGTRVDIQRKTVYLPVDRNVVRAFTRWKDGSEIGEFVDCLRKINDPRIALLVGAGLEGVGRDAVSGLRLNTDKGTKIVPPHVEKLLLIAAAHLARNDHIAFNKLVDALVLPETGSPYYDAVFGRMLMGDMTSTLQVYASLSDIASAGKFAGFKIQDCPVFHAGINYYVEAVKFRIQSFDDRKKSTEQWYDRLIRLEVKNLFAVKLFGKDLSGPKNCLTVPESDELHNLVAGKSTSEIEAELDISTRTKLKEEAVERVTREYMETRAARTLAIRNILLDRHAEIREGDTTYLIVPKEQILRYLVGALSDVSDSQNVLFALFSIGSTPPRAEYLEI